LPARVRIAAMPYLQRAAGDEVAAAHLRGLLVGAALDEAAAMRAYAALGFEV
jgi:hypothetical protein